MLTIIIKKESENVQNLFDFPSFQDLDNTEEIMDSSKDSENMNISDNNSEEIIDNLNDYDAEEITVDLEENDDEFMDIETDSVDSEDFHGANFEDAVNETLDDFVQQWPNEIYQAFAKICVNNDLSNHATDSFIKFFNKNANIKESPLPKNSREMYKFMDSLAAPNLDFKKKYIINFEGIVYNLHYRPIIKTIKALLQKPDVIKDFVFRFEEKQRVNMVSNLTLLIIKCNCLT